MDARAAVRQAFAVAWRTHRPYLAMAVALFASGCVLGVLIVDQVDLFAAIGLGGLENALPEDISVGVILLNNTVVFAFTLLGVLSFGLLTAAVLLFNGVILGYVAVPAARDSGVEFVVLALVPHAVFELTAFFLAAAVAFRLIHKFIQRIRDRRARIISPGEGRQIVGLLAVAWVLLALAAVIEVYVTFWLVETFA